MEANNGVLNKITAKKNVLHSIAWKYCARQAIEGDREKEDFEMCVGEKSVILLSQDELDVLSSFFSEQKQTIYKHVIIRGQKYTSTKSKEGASIDFFIQLKQNIIGIVKFYFVCEFIVYGFIETYEIINQLDHFYIVESTGLHKVFKACNITKKLLCIKVCNKQIVTSIPNMFEKT